MIPTITCRSPSAVIDEPTIARSAPNRPLPETVTEVWRKGPLREPSKRWASMTSNGASILDDPIAQLLLSGKASTPSEAERQYLDDHLDDVLALIDSPLSDDEFRRVTRINVYSAASAMGMMLLQPGAFDPKATGTQEIAGRLYAEAPIEDGRLGKTVRYDVTFAAAIGAAAR